MEEISEYERSRKQNQFIERGIIFGMIGISLIYASSFMMENPSISFQQYLVGALLGGIYCFVGHLMYKKRM